MTCKICNSDCTRLFEKKILQKYTSWYYQCVSCNFVQTDEPVWLEEAYSSAITSLDIGLIDRNFVLKEEVCLILDACFAKDAVFLDYAGGYGMFVRMMRDAGYDFYRQDIYCENLFAKHFDIEDKQLAHFDAVTAFEVFEHFADPMPEIKKIAAFSEHIIFSTKLLPQDKTEIENWWYIAPETGQHIAFYDTKTLHYIAKTLNRNYYFNDRNCHVFTTKTLSPEQLHYAFNAPEPKKSFFGQKNVPVNLKVVRESLLQKDFTYIQNLLNSGKK